MGEPYYRISTAQSELEGILYDQSELSNRLTVEGHLVAQQTEGRETFPRMSRIMATHRFPFRRQFRPMTIMANQILTHANSSNNRFTIEYGGEYIARMYQAVDIRAGTLAADVGIATQGWQYCPNWVSVMLELASFKVSTDTLYEFSGDMLYVFYAIISPMSQRVALARMLGETTYELKFTPGGVANTVSYDDPATFLLSVFDNVVMAHQYTPAQSYAVTHPAMTVYIPYNLFTMSNVENAYPEASVYSLNRTLEYTFRAFSRFINVYATDLIPVSGFAAPNLNGAAVYPTWTTTPAITATRLNVEHIVLHRDLQKLIAVSPHAFMIRQYTKDSLTVSDARSHELAVTKVIESIYILSCFDRNTTGTTAVPGGVVITGAGGAVPAVYAIDPFYLPVNTTPLTGITISARGQNFYQNQTWDELSQVHQFLFGKSDNASTANAALAQIEFGLYYAQPDHTGSYNSGWGPNLRISWTASAFSAANQGIITFLITGINMVLCYRGALTVRYT